MITDEIRWLLSKKTSYIVPKEAIYFQGDEKIYLKDQWTKYIDQGFPMDLPSIDGKRGEIGCILHR